MGALVMRNYPASVLSNWFDTFFDAPAFRTDWEPAAPRVITPRMDFSEEENHYFLRADIPGLEKKDVSITVDNGILRIEGETKEVRKGKYHHSERAYGKFSRSFSLPDEVDAQKIEAKMSNGVLELVLPKNEKAKAIEIKIN